MDGLLNKATTADENPTPGYVYPELIKLTHADVGNCDKMADWLYRRLQRAEPSVKYTVLQVMKLVSKGGRLEFRRALQRQNEAVKVCLQFKGPPDPLRGDEPYRKVKDAAKDALEAMFDSSAAPAAGSGAAAMSGRITGQSGGAFPPPSGPNYPPPSPASELPFISFTKRLSLPLSPHAPLTALPPPPLPLLLLLALLALPPPLLLLLPPPLLALLLLLALAGGFGAQAPLAEGMGALGLARPALPTAAMMACTLSAASAASCAFSAATASRSAAAAARSAAR
jgi:hypothetical protein